MAPFGTLYTLKGRIHPRTRKIFAVARINGLELTLPMFIPFKSNKTPGYLAKFPTGKFPALETATGFCVSESNAVAYYVAEAGPNKDQLLGATPEERALVQFWIFYSELQLEPALWKVAVWRRGMVPFDARSETEGAAALPKLLDHVEASLRGKKWLVSDATGPSLADLTISAVIFFGYLTFIDAEMRAQYPETLRWVGQVMAMPELKGLYDDEFIEKRLDPPV
ncbi:glutathione S-transferase [Thozetella sp. PMI_491]|nr:glutathione S-transferase [Thozetella sp. PMI_491]